MVAKKQAEEYDLGLSLGGVYNKRRGSTCRWASLPTEREMELMRERLTEVQALSKVMAASLKLNTTTIHEGRIDGAARLPRLASAGGSGRLAATSSTLSGELMSTDQSSDRPTVKTSMMAKESNADHDPSKRASRRCNGNVARAIRRYRKNNVSNSMPHVKTVGADGKRVEGYLYKYLTGKVRIVCVCHGFFQSPAEFVNHAGGNVVGNPLKQIAVSL